MSEARRVLGRGAVCLLLKVLHRAGRLALLPTRIDSVGADYVVLKRALPYAVELTWNPELYDLSSKLVQESGYEDFTVQFKWGACGEGAGGSALHPRATSRPPASSADTYTGQQEAKGYNAFQVDTCRNCWIRRVRMVNCDNAVYVLNSDSCTVRCASCWSAAREWLGGVGGRTGTSIPHLLQSGASAHLAPSWTEHKLSRSPPAHPSPRVPQRHPRGRDCATRWPERGRA